MVENKITTEELLSDIADLAPRPLGDGEITAQMFAEKTGYSMSGARAFLKTLVRKGVLESHETFYDGKIVLAYRKIK